MSLKERLTADMKIAMKEREAGKQRLGVIRLVRGAIRQKEIDEKKDLTDDAILAIISKEVKQRKDSIEEFKKGNRDDLVKQNEEEIAILLEYLPEQLSSEEVSALVREIIQKEGFSSPKDMGKVMQMIMPKVQGKADGKMVNTIVRDLLQA